MFTRLFLLVFALMLGSNVWAIKKPKYSFAVYGGLSGSNLLWREAPERNYDPELLEEFFGYEVTTPYKSYVPDTIHNGSSNAYGILPFDYTTSFLKDLIFNIAAGVSIDIPIKKSEHWSVKFQSTYQTIGTSLDNQRTETLKYGGNEVTSTTLFKRNISNSYLIMPLMAKYTWYGRTSFFIQGGPYAGLLLKSKVSGSSLVSQVQDGAMVSDGNELGTYSFVNDTSAYNHTHMLDYGINLGAGFEFYWTKTAYITLDMNVGMGLRKIDKLYSNTYTELDLTNFSTRDLPESPYISRNYYSYSSNAKNFYVMFTVGFRYSVYK